MRNYYTACFLVYLELCLSNARLLASAKLFEMNDDPLPARAKEIMNTLEEVRGHFERTRRSHLRFINEESRRDIHDMQMMQLNSQLIAAHKSMHDVKQIQPKDFSGNKLTDDLINMVGPTIQQ